MLKSLRLIEFRNHWESLAEKALQEQWRPEHYLKKRSNINN
jgi:hypothetical protein